MDATRNTISEPELLDRMQLVAESFRPAAPIDRRSLFSGRADQIGEVFSVVAQPGQHAVIYGERGVGKTSLAAVAVRAARGCERPDRPRDLRRERRLLDASGGRRSARSSSVRAAREVGFSGTLGQSSETGASALGSGPVTPDAVREVLQRLGRHGSVAIFIDEFDRLRDPRRARALRGHDQGAL